MFLFTQTPIGNVILVHVWSCLFIYFMCRLENSFSNPDPTSSNYIRWLKVWINSQRFNFSKLAEEHWGGICRRKAKNEFFKLWPCVELKLLKCSHHLQCILVLQCECRCVYFDFCYVFYLTICILKIIYLINALCVNYPFYCLFHCISGEFGLVQKWFCFYVAIDVLFTTAVFSQQRSLYGREDASTWLPTRPEPELKSLIGVH